MIWLFRFALIINFFVCLSCSPQERRAQMRTGTQVGMPGARGATALVPVGAEPLILYAGVSMEGEPGLTHTYHKLLY